MTASDFVSLVNRRDSQPGSQVQGTKSNLLLTGLSAKAQSELQNRLRVEDFTIGTVLWEVGAHIDQVVFPASGAISIRVPTKEGNGIQVAIVGPESGVGFPDGVGGSTAITRAEVQVPGRFATIPAPAFAAAAERNEEIKRLAPVCNNWLLIQSQQLAACNASHSADARFCRWLLRASDTLALSVIPVTQEVIAEALGIRRTTATLIAQQLQMRGIISYSRGRIMIRDRAGLQTAACDCAHTLGPAHWPSEILRFDASTALDGRADWPKV
jgi:CRP-like cAMP-binding protein